MLEYIQLSERSQQLASQLFVSGSQFDAPGIEFSSLISWLNDESILPLAIQADEDTEFLKTALRTTLLHDLLVAMSDHVTELAEEQEINWANVAKMALLACTGTLVAACQGFDSVAMMLSMLPLPSWVIIVVGIAFSLLSIAVFYGFDLVQASHILGVKLTNAPKLLDMYLLQLNNIKAIQRQFISHYTLTELSLAELAQIECILSMLQARLKALTKDCKQFDEARNSYAIKISQFLFSSVTGLLFFGGGFFAGQSVALFVMGLFVVSVSPTCLPVIIFSLLVGLAAFSLYWYINLNELNKLMSKWFGLDENTIAHLSDISSLTKQEHKLEQLKNNVVGISKLKEDNSQMEQQLENKNEPSNSKLSNNKNGFYSHAKPHVKSSDILDIIQNETIIMI